MAMAHKNIIAGLALIAFGAWYAYLIGGLPERTTMPNTPGPSFFPIIIVSAVLLLSAALLILGLVNARKATDAPAGQHSPPGAILAITAFVTYLVVLSSAGFIIASVPFFAVLMYLYGSRNRLMIASASLIVPIALFVMFQYGFQIILPRGLLAF